MAYATATYALIAAAVAAAGTVYSGVQQKKAADTNAAISEQNAIAAQQKAAYDEQMHREGVKKLLSAQRALYGKSGVEMAGSPLLVMEDTAAQGELDALAIRYGGDVNAARNRSAANLSRMQGSTAMTASYFQAGSTLLSGAASAKGDQLKSQTVNSDYAAGKY